MKLVNKQIVKHVIQFCQNWYLRVFASSGVLS
jgi:hypothetical protein